MNYEIGDMVRVGHHFWIETALGFSMDAKHNHDSFEIPRSGSADENCQVQVVEKTTADSWVVKLIRIGTAYGALAAHGTIFTINPEIFAQWDRDIIDRSKLMSESQAIMMRINRTLAGL